MTAGLGALLVCVALVAAALPDGKPGPHPGRVVTWEEAVARADAALYEAKRRGRNCWVDARELDALDAPAPAPPLDGPATAAGGPD